MSEHTLDDLAALERELSELGAIVLRARTGHWVEFSVQGTFTAFVDRTISGEGPKLGGKLMAIYAVIRQWQASAEPAAPPDIELPGRAGTPITLKVGSMKRIEPSVTFEPAPPPAAPVVTIRLSLAEAEALVLDLSYWIVHWGGLSPESTGIRDRLGVAAYDAALKAEKGGDPECQKP